MNKRYYKILKPLLVLILLSCGVSAKEVSPAIEGLRRGMIEAVYKGEKDAVSFFLDSKVSPDTRNEDGKTILMIAAERGREEIVKLLLSRGADKKLTFKASPKLPPQTARDLAIQAGQQKTANLLK